jgi:hypothetical protein
MTRRCPPRRKPPRWLGPKPRDASDLGIPDAPKRVPPEPFSIALAPEEPPPDLDDRHPRSLHDAIPLAPPGFGAGPVIDHGATDRETFRAFFDSLGVPYTKDADPHRGLSLLVAGAHFVFGRAGDFLGVECAETGRRESRKS